MTQMGRVRSMVCVLVAVTPVITPFGAAPVASNADGRFIVIYVDGPNLNSQKLLLEALGVEVTQVLTLINALAIKIPFGLIAYALGLLDPLNPDPLDVINDKVAVYSGVMGLAAEVTPTTMANPSADSSAEGLGWGGAHIGVLNVQQQPKPDGAGVAGGRPGYGDRLCASRAASEYRPVSGIQRLCRSEPVYR